MSTIRSKSGSPEKSPAEQPRFFYGFRYVAVTDEKGRRRWVQQPLTREDVLHPREGDHVTQNSDHDRDCRYLCNVLQLRVAPEPDTVVYHDMRVNWDVPGLDGHGPDISLMKKVRDPERRRDSFDAAEEGVRPSLIIEVTAPSTRDVDLNDKRRQYWQAGVPVYVIVDEQLWRGRRHLRIIPYVRGPRGYRRQSLGARGWFWLEAVQLWLGQEASRVALFDAEGRRMPGYAEQTEARRQAEHARQQAEAELARLQAELRGEE